MLLLVAQVLQRITVTIGIATEFKVWCFFNYMEHLFIYLTMQPVTQTILPPRREHYISVF